MPNWNDIKKLSVEEGLPPNIVAAEPMQIAFLDGFYGEKDSLDVVFHGGTAIRLLHGGYRYSEDLDFCVPLSFASKTLDSLVQKAFKRAEDLLSLYFGESGTELRKREGQKKIATWWLIVSPPNERQKYRVKIEFGTYPAYAKQPLPLTVRNRFMPRNPVVISVGVKELLADKISALSDRPYVKERDFFDVWYLVNVLGAPLDIELVKNKLRDYNAKNPKELLKNRLNSLNARTFAENMARFLPAVYRASLSKDNYDGVMVCCRGIIEDVLKRL